MGRDKRSARVLSWRSLLHFILIVELAVFADVLTALLDVRLPAVLLYPAALILWVLLNRFSRVRGKKLICLCLALPCALILCGIAAYGAWRIAAPGQQYAAVETGKESLYGGQRVMVIVPHEDDDLNLTSGVIEEYVKHGSEVYMVFMTNGDYYGIGETRLNEAIRAAAFVGIPEERVIFLGYGDQWNGDGPHIYNAEPGELRTSANGRTETYGIPGHPAYSDGHAYTIDNLLSDMKGVILEYRPDTILCSDYDLHFDHRATTLVFEKAMGEILREVDDYAPTVLKGYAYNAAWRAEPDYFTANIRSTLNVFEEPYNQRPQIYAWEDRIRLPVDAANLSRSLYASKGHRSLAVYASQRAAWRAAAIMNGDKVFWQRRTDSLCYGATVTASSGDADKLNDFMLLDTNDMYGHSDEPCDGAWVPDAGDAQRTVTVVLGEPRDIQEIVLYDNPSERDNILNAVITFDNGSTFTTGALDPCGRASVYAVGQEGVTSFEIAIAESEGEAAGITEIEAYEAPREAFATYIKLMDGEGNFAYDYITPEEDGEAEFWLYGYGESGALDAGSYSVTSDNAACTAEIAGDRIHVTCPSGEAFTLTVTWERDAAVSDSVYVQNPGGNRRAEIRAIQGLENFIINLYYQPVVKRTVAYRTYAALRSALVRLIAR